MNRSPCPEGQVESRRHLKQPGCTGLDRGGKERRLWGVKTQYEYKIVKYDASAFSLGHHPSSSDELEMQSDFNDLGEDGWDLVGVVTIDVAPGKTERCVYTFKRELHEESI